MVQPPFLQDEPASPCSGEYSTPLCMYSFPYCEVSPCQYIPHLMTSSLQLQKDMEPHLEKLEISFRSWVIYMAQLTTPLDHLMLIVLRSFLKVFVRMGRMTRRERKCSASGTYTFSPFYLQTPLCVVKPGRKQRSKANAASGERVLFHPDDFGPFYDPCIPLVMVWDGQDRWWPTVPMGPTQVMEAKLKTLWQQVSTYVILHMLVFVFVESS